MPVPARLLAPPWLFPAAVALVLLAIGRAEAAAPPLGLITKVDEAESNLFLWEAPFSLWRWVIFALATGVAWFVCFNVLMLSALSLDNPRPPRPKEAFARAAGWFILFAAVAFVVVFAVLANDLYRKPWVNSFPKPLTGLNYHFPWVAVLILGVVLMSVARFLFRR